MDWFLYDNDLRHERVKATEQTVRESLRRTLPEDFVDKTTDKVQRFQNLKIKEIKSGTKQITASWKKSTKQ